MSEDINRILKLAGCGPIKPITVEPETLTESKTPIVKEAKTSFPLFRSLIKK